MELHFTRPDILNAVLRDAHGVPLYRIETNNTVFSEGTTTISRIIGSSGPGSSQRVLADNMSDTDILLQGLEEQPVAYIVWRRVKQSIFKFDGRELKVDDYMPSSKSHMKQRNFTAKNGCEYTWDYMQGGCKLMKGASSTAQEDRVVEHRRRKRTVSGKEAHYPWLEITPEGLSIVDEIIMTFVWIERRRSLSYVEPKSWSGRRILREGEEPEPELENE